MSEAPSEHVETFDETSMKLSGQEDMDRSGLAGKNDGTAYRPV